MQYNISGILDDAGRRYGVDPRTLNTFARIESGGNPSARTGSYHGLFQLSPQEFNKYGGGDIYNPGDNANAAARKISVESQQFQNQYGRAPTAADLYMIHQQGAGGYASHMANPDAPAWQNMRGTGEGRQKGDNWARAAIWGNVPDDVKDQYGSVDNMTSRQFMDLWSDKVNRFGGAPVGAVSRSWPTQRQPADLPDAITRGMNVPGSENMMAYAQQPGGLTEIAPAQRRPTQGAYGPALSSGTVAGGPGILSPDADLGSGLQGAGAYLMGISDPRALGALANIGPKPGRYTAAYDQNTGKYRILDGQTGRYTQTSQDPDWKSPAMLEAEKKAAENGEEVNKGLQAGATSAQMGRGRLDLAKQLASDPNIYTGAGGETMNMVRKGLAGVGLKQYEGQGNAELFNSLSNEAVGDFKNAVGNITRLTNYDISGYIKPAIFGLNNGKEGNLKIISQLERPHILNDELNQLAQQYRDPNTNVLNNAAFQPKAQELVKQRVAQWQADDTQATHTAPARTTAQPQQGQPQQRVPLNQIFR